MKYFINYNHRRAKCKKNKIVKTYFVIYLRKSAISLIWHPLSPINYLFMPASGTRLFVRRTANSVSVEVCDHGCCYITKTTGPTCSCYAGSKFLEYRLHDRCTVGIEFRSESLPLPGCRRGRGYDSTAVVSIILFSADVPRRATGTLCRFGVSGNV